MAKSCCCSCNPPAHKRSGYGERCSRCGKHRAPGGRICWVEEDWTPEPVADTAMERLDTYLHDSLPWRLSDEQMSTIIHLALEAAPSDDLVKELKRRGVMIPYFGSSEVYRIRPDALAP